MVAKLGAPGVLHESHVEANNWMSALRAARQAMSERPSVPPGASCSIDAQGVATVLDPSSRRKFVLSPLTSTVEPATSAPADAAVPQAAQAKKKKFQTVALIPDRAPAAAAPVVVSGPTGSAAPAHSVGMSSPRPNVPAAESNAPNQPARTATASAPAASAERSGKKKRFETVGFGAEFSSPAAKVASASSASSTRPRTDSASVRTSQKPRPNLELLLERNDEPTQENPLRYIERAYLLPKGCTVPEAEAELRWKLADLQQALSDRPRGQFINLAVFDHRWRDVPERPPVIVLQWRDWRGEVTVDYPAAARISSLPPPSRPHEDQLADVFEALEELSRLQSPAEGLDFAVRLLSRTIPAEAISACLYDINTDELRFVALSGTGAAQLQGQAVPRGAGLFGQAARTENRASVFADVRVEPTFNPEVDGRPGLDARNMLLRPITRDNQLLGMLQLVNRTGPGVFSTEDVNAVNYVAERLAEFLHATRMRRRSLS